MMLHGFIERACPMPYYFIDACVVRVIVRTIGNWDWFLKIWDTHTHEILECQRSHEVVLNNIEHLYGIVLGSSIDFCLRLCPLPWFGFGWGRWCVALASHMAHCHLWMTTQHVLFQKLSVLTQKREGDLKISFESYYDVIWLLMCDMTTWYNL